MPEQEITRFTDAFSGSIEKLYKTGGFALAFGFAGIVMMLGARTFGQEESLWLMFLGATLTFSCFGFFLYTTLKGNAKATQAISNNKEAIDAVQDISIQLTRLTYTLQAYSFKNIDKINQVLTIAIPKIKSIPLLGEKLSEFGLDDVTTISQAIVHNSAKIELLVTEIEEALVGADHEKLKAYSTELSLMIVNLKEELKK